VWFSGTPNRQANERINCHAGKAEQYVRTKVLKDELLDFL